MRRGGHGVSARAWRLVAGLNFIHFKTKGILDFIKTKNTGSGKVELFEVPAPYTEQPTVATPTTFSPADANNGWFQMDGSTLVFIKTKNTGSQISGSM